jgi:hypothetical protein
MQVVPLQPPLLPPPQVALHQICPPHLLSVQPQSPATQCVFGVQQLPALHV